MIPFANLDESNFTRKVIHYTLITRGVPPFYCEIKFSSCRNQPIINFSYNFIKCPHPVYFVF